VEIYGKNWKKIAEILQTRTSVQCLHRWTKILKPGLIKGPWTIEEDKKLAEWVKSNGPNKWSQCAEFMKGRSGKQCRERWCNSLCPGVKKGNWTSYEDYMIFKLYNEYGSKWAKIASFLKGRTENSIKNRFYSTLRRLAYEDQKKENVTQLPRDKFISQKDLLNYLPQAIKEKEHYYNLEKDNFKNTDNTLSEEDSGSSGLKKIKVKTIISNDKEMKVKCEDVDSYDEGVNVGLGPGLSAPQIPFAPNNINVNFNTALLAPNSNYQLNQYLNNLLLYQMSNLENTFNQTKSEVNSYNALKTQFIQIFNMMQQGNTKI
jgi:hypothetical protein